MSILHLTILMCFLFLCFLLVCAVLLQPPKGSGGLAGLGGGGADSAFGVHTVNILQKFTAVCVILFFVLVVVLAHTDKPVKSDSKSVMDNYVEKAKEPGAAPSPAGAPTP